MQLRLNVDTAEPLSLQNQIFEQLRSLILDGQLRVGEILPATRALSEQLNVSRNTVALAYERLASEGYIESRGSVGTFVSADIPESTLQSISGTHLENVPASTRHRRSVARPRAQALVNPHRNRLIADFSVGRPAPDSFPHQVWAKLIAARLKSAGSALTEYRDPAGYIELRQEIASHLRSARGVTAHPNHLIIVGGCQDGLNLVCRMLVKKPGSPAIVESPCYQGAAYLFESFNAKLFPVDVDDKGIEVTRLPDIKKGIAYVTPSHQYPLGVTMSLDRRLELLRWASRTDSYIIEDDYDSDFRFHGSPMTALKGLDRDGRVIYLGTFSKSIGAGIRIGYVVMPPGMAAAATAMKTLMNNGQPWLEQAVLADFMSSGGFKRHLRKIRMLYLARRNALLGALTSHFGESEVIGDDAGMHLAWRVPDEFPSASEIQARALETGVGVYTLSSGAAVDFDPDRRGDRHLVLGFSSLSEDKIKEGISRLAAALKTEREPAPAPELSVYPEVL